MEEALRIFFPSEENRHVPTIRKYAEAKRFCDECPVTEECYTEAMTSGEQASLQFGMWGGLSPTERARRWENEREERYRRYA